MQIMKAVKLTAIVNVTFIQLYLSIRKLSTKLFRQFRKSMMLMAFDSISTQRYR